MSGRLLDLIRAVNEANAQIISLDLPSGLESDGGRVIGEAVRADVTCGDGIPEAGRTSCIRPPRTPGTPSVVRVDYPVEIRRRVSPWAAGADAGKARSREFPRGDRTDNKWDRSDACWCVAGSPGMTGAAILTCRGALRAGAGLVVYLGGARDLATDLRGRRFPRSSAYRGPARTQAGGTRSRPASRRPTPWPSAPAWGSGHRSRISFVASSIRIPAGWSSMRTAWRAVGASPKTLSLACGAGDSHPSSRGVRAVDGEARRERRSNSPRSRGRVCRGPWGRALAQRAAEFRSGSRHRAGRQPHREYRACYRRKRRRPDGSSGRTCGESECPFADAAVLGAYVHGLAADIYARDRSERSLVPTELVDLIPRAFREIERSNESSR